MSRKSWNVVTRLSCSAKRDRKRPLLRSPEKSATFTPSFPACLRLQKFFLFIFPLLFIMKKCYIIGRNSNFLAINWS